MKKRLTFRCWSCKETYTLFKEYSPKQKLRVACPYCGKEAIVDLAPYRTTVMEIQKDEDEGEQDIGVALDLPDVLPTQALKSE